MKKLLFLLIFIPILANSQVQVAWIDSVKVPVTDTVIEYAKIVFQSFNDVSSMSWTCEFDMSRLDSSVIVNFGGGNSIIRTSPQLHSFNSIAGDSLPYTLSRLKWRKTINGISQNKKVLSGEVGWGFVVPAMYIKRSGCTAGKYLLFNCKFYRQ